MTRRGEPSRMPDRAKRDADLRREVQRLFKENLRVYRVLKVWRQSRREGVKVARCTVERMMRNMDLRGVIRDKLVKPIVSDKPVPRLVDHVKRQLWAPQPNVLWISDFIYVAT